MKKPREERNYCIYKYTSPSGKAYIGLTNNYKRRTKEHKMPSNRGSTIRKAVDKYGWDNFKHEILFFGLTREEAMYHEAKCIELHNTLAPFGYNLTSGGTAPRHNQETRERMRQSHLGKKQSPEAIEKTRKANLGRIHPPETVEKIRQARLGKKQSPEAIEKTRKANLGKKRSPEIIENLRKVNLGRERSPETRDKIRQARLGKKQSPEAIEKTRQASLGRTHSPETRLKISLANKGKPRKTSHLAAYREAPRTTEEKQRIQLANVTRAYQNVVNNPTKFFGIQKQGQKWVAKMGVDGVQVRLGAFPTPDEAFEAYKSALFKRYEELQQNFLTRGDLK